MELLVAILLEYAKLVGIILLPFIIIACIIKIVGRNKHDTQLKSEELEELSNDEWYKIIGLTVINYIPLIFSSLVTNMIYTPIVLILIAMNRKFTKRDLSFTFLNLNLAVATYLATKRDVSEFMELHSYDTESGAVLSLKMLILPIMILVITLICVRCRNEISNIIDKVDVYKNEKEKLDNEAETNMLDSYGKILKAFVGEKIKLNHKIKLNFYAAIFGPGWFFYRKADKVGIIDSIVCMISLIMGPIGIFAMFLIHLFWATNVYIWWAKRRVDKIIGENINSSEAEKIVLAMQNGRTSVEGIKTYIAVLIVQAFIVICIIFWLLSGISSV